MLGRRTRIARRLRAAVVLVAVVQLTAGAAHAETATFAPPYASDQESCLGNGTCDAAADSATGDLQVTAAAAAIPRIYSSADASAEVVAIHTLGAKADAVNYTVNFDVLEGVAQAVGETCWMWDCVNAAVRLVAWAEHRNCQECWSPRVVEECRATGLVADECTLPSGRLSLALALTNLSGGSVPAGTVVLSARLEAEANADPNSLPGVVESSARGRAIVANVVAESNNTPVAMDDSVSTGIGSPVKINVLANDSDPDGDPLTVGIAWPVPANGSAAVNPDQTVTYTPRGCFSGTDSFTYWIDDGNGGSDSGVVKVQVRKTRGSTGC
jgi:hypothetical protein